MIWLLHGVPRYTRCHFSGKEVTRIRSLPRAVGIACLNPVFLLRTCQIFRRLSETSGGMDRIITGLVVIDTAASSFSGLFPLFLFSCFTWFLEMMVAERIVLNRDKNLIYANNFLLLLVNHQVPGKVKELIRYFSPHFFIGNCFFQAVRVIEKVLHCLLLFDVALSCNPLLSNFDHCFLMNLNLE